MEIESSSDASDELSDSTVRSVITGPLSSLGGDCESWEDASSESSKCT